MSNFLSLLNNDIFCLLFGFVFSFLIITFLLDNREFSKNRIICILQKTLFIFILLFLLFVILNFFYLNYFNSIECMSDRSITDIINSDSINNNLKTISDKSNNELSVNGNLTGILNLSKEAGQEIAKGINSGVSNLGLGASIGGTAAAAAKIASGSPLQKLAIVTLGAATGGIIHVAATSTNRAISETILNNKSNLENSSPISPISPSSIYESNFFDSLSNNPVESLILSIQYLQLISLSLIFLLIVLLLFKYIANKNFEFKFINKIFSHPYNSKIIFIFQKLIKIWSTSSIINIILIIILLLINMFASIYYMGILINNFEDFCTLYLKYINK
jgi:hypothetical protein